MKRSKQELEQIINQEIEKVKNGKTLGEVEQDYSSHVRKLVSRALNEKDLISQKTNILVNRKINIQMNKELHKQANDTARGLIIENKIKEGKPKTFNVKRIINDGSDSYKDVIYVVGDVHYRGEQDDQLVINTFSQIKSEIKERGYHDVTLVLTGDNIDGEIHNEQQRTNEPVIDATMRLINLYVDLINKIPNISKVYMVYGNHEEIRLGGDKGTENNIGKFIYGGLKNCLKYAQISANNELIFDYKGKKVLLLHGHQNYAKSKAKIVEHCAVKYNLQPDYIILGHFHTSKANQFSKNHGLITAPAVKNGESNGDSNNGYCGLGQYIKLKLNFSTPQITTVNVEIGE